MKYCCVGDRNFNKTCCFVVSQINMCRFYGEHLGLVRYKDKARGASRQYTLNDHERVKPFKQELLAEGRLASSYNYKLVNMAKFKALPDDKHNLH